MSPTGVGVGVSPAFRRKRGKLWLPTDLPTLDTWLKSSLGATTSAANIVADGDAEAVGVAAWIPSSATLTKEVTTPHGGLQCLRATKTADPGAAIASQVVFVPGEQYQIDAWARSDGVCRPQIRDSGGGNTWTGTTSTSWQNLSTTWTANGTTIQFRTVFGEGTIGNYVEFDDIVVNRVSAVNLSALADQSGNGHHLPQTVGLKQPIYHANGGPNGVPWIEFDGLYHYLKAVWSLSQPLTRIIVCKPSISDGTSKALFDGSTTVSCLLYVVVADQLRLAIGGSINFSAVESTDWHYVTSIVNGASSSLNVDGGTPVAGSLAGTAPNGLTIGVRGNESTHPADMGFVELIDCTSVLTVDELTAIGEYFTREYALP